ncbi:MAG: hypothetical protein KDE26_15170 [Bacteroidetes bacterium]|nr:hypothetical protein [Bacteroidota bacterium]MCB0844593.1 hypothetical protein [Bacteroidota bacterium]
MLLFIIGIFIQSTLLGQKVYQLRVDESIFNRKMRGEIRLFPDGNYEYTFNHCLQNSFSTGIWKEVGDTILLERIPIESLIDLFDSMRENRSNDQAYLRSQLSKLSRPDFFLPEEKFYKEKEMLIHIRLNMTFHLVK